MIESENLRTASLYINNQLLSRGLLRDGHSIDFAHPGDSEGEVAETMSRIMAVVNDLILRRDRDAEHRESLSATLRTLRAESLRQANDIQHLQEKHAEVQRKAGLSEAAEAALRTHLKTAEATVHRLKEEAARTKSLVAQTRASCANEIRKRDRQIESLKKAVTEAGRARGVGRNTGVTTITVVGDVGSEADLALAGGGPDQGHHDDLRTETNAFLAELAKGLSEENEALLQLVRRTTEQLKEMSGWEVASGTPMEGGDGHALPLASNPADMASEVDAVLEHLRTILTNPSFVPIEEVVVREDEIHRLRDGWEKMETRWKEAVHLIDGWRKRMQASGRPVNVEELKMGLRLSPVKVHNVEETTQGFGLRLEAVPEGEEADLAQHYYEDEHLNLVSYHEIDHIESDASSEFGGDLDVDGLDEEEPNVQILQQSVMLAAPEVPAPLRDSHTAGNRGTRSHHRRHPREVTTVTEEKMQDVAEEDVPSMPPPPPPHRTQHSPQRRPLLSLRPVPPEEAAQVALPPSAVATTPDTSVDSIPLSKPAEEPTSKTSTASARTHKKPTPTVKRKEVTKEKEAAKREPTKREAARKTEPEPTKRATKPPAKARPTRPPITRGRSETRSDNVKQTKPAPRAASATSVTSSRSAGTTKTTNTDHVMPPPPPPARGSAQAQAESPSRSPKRVNSRLPLPRPGSNNVLPAPQQSPVTISNITAKLAASERDADAARVRAKLKAARLGKGVSLPPPGAAAAASTTSSAAAEADGEANSGGMSTRSESDSVTGSASTFTSTSDASRRGPSSITTGNSTEDDVDELGMSPLPPLPPQNKQLHLQEEQPQQQHHELGEQQKKPTRKRERRTSKVASRRRSTLNPWELDALIQGGR
ncbi:hypothetical protein VTI74DRAFT_4566 [Chaetomium olivicolor]